MPRLLGGWREGVEVKKIEFENGAASNSEAIRERVCVILSVRQLRRGAGVGEREQPPYCILFIFFRLICL